MRGGTVPAIRYLIQINLTALSGCNHQRSLSFAMPTPPNPESNPTRPSADNADGPTIRSDRDETGLSGDPTPNTPQSSPQSPLPIPLHHSSLSFLHRATLAAFGVFLISGFALAGYLKPNPQGFGTHQSLGLPPCSVKMMFGIPCPSCGMTTSFAHFVRGQIPSSLRANAAGTLLACVSLVVMFWCFVTAKTGRYLWFRDPATVFAYGLSIVAVITLMYWGWRLWIDGYA